MTTAAAECRSLPYLAKKGTATQLLVHEQPFIMLAGEVHNSSSSSLQYMEQVWPTITGLHCNTALVPITWELFEPEEGRFDYTLVDGLMAGARQHHLHLVFLWFGSWKNAVSTYAPAWVKTDSRRFSRLQTSAGINSSTLSCFSDEACRADARAFATLMRHLRDIDSAEQTVLMAQVENEVGVLGAIRDYSPPAEEAFHRPVPAELPAYLEACRDHLQSALRESPRATAAIGDAAWSAVFGDVANEVFMAWHIGKYVGKVAQAGQDEYPLPMFVNAWLAPADPPIPAQGYPIGGPVSRMMDIWRCAAPNIPIMAPDIYAPEFRQVCAQYSANGNPLFIPEARRDESAAAHVFYALGQHDAICFAPFGIESMASGEITTMAGTIQAEAHNMAAADHGRKLAQSYALLQSMMPVICSYQGTGRMAGVLQGEDREQRLILGGYELVIQFSHPRREGETPGAAIIIAVQDDEYLIAGHGLSVNFRPIRGNSPHIDFLAIDEGWYHDGVWVQGRRLNGDELQVRLESMPAIRRVALYS